MKPNPLPPALGALFALLIDSLASAAAKPVLPMPPAEIVRRFKYDDFVIEDDDDAGGGVMGARKLELRFKDGKELEAKWKRTEESLDSWNNSPRREIGAYAVQELFLDPADYLVPPVAARCIPLDVYREVDDDAEPTRKGSTCVFGVLSAWLDNVEEPDEILDTERLAADQRYRFNATNLNLLHYLTVNRDARDNNFLMAKDPADGRIFSIDNGIAFGGTLYNFFTWHFDEIRVSGLPKKSIDRLRQVTRQDLNRLGVLGQLQTDGSGVWRNVPLTANLDPETGVRLYDNGVQFGLTREEIDAIAERLQTLLTRIDAGELQVF